MKKKADVKYGKKSLMDVTTRDYIGSVKAKERSVLRDGDHEMPSAVVQELAELPGVGHTISVRAAKAHLSGLLDEVAAGREVVITSDGVPKARLVPMVQHPRKVFMGLGSISKRCRRGLAERPPTRSSARIATPEADDVFGHRDHRQVARHGSR